MPSASVSTAISEAGLLEQHPSAKTQSASSPPFAQRCFRAIPYGCLDEAHHGNDSGPAMDDGSGSTMMAGSRGMLQSPNVKIHVLRGLLGFGFLAVALQYAPVCGWWTLIPAVGALCALADVRCAGSWASRARSWAGSELHSAWTGDVPTGRRHQIRRKGRRNYWPVSPAPRVQPLRMSRVAEGEAVSRAPRRPTT